MFRVPPDEHRDRDSFVSVLGHDYAEIPYTVHSTPTDNRLTPRDSFPVSDSSMSDGCLHHIACPSSDSSLSEDYLHPVASGRQAETISTTRPHVSNTQASAHNAARPGQPGKGSVHGDGERIAELKAESPYANM
ncbi:uncharacterized protein [Littorina saxatilis]|uniref:uncharacterized protein n=1 Tax=Littorina saxatilis TaxID=31220 RepID=UPI0038B4765C